MNSGQVVASRCDAKAGTVAPREEDRARVYILLASLVRCGYSLAAAGKFGEAQWNSVLGDPPMQVKLLHEIGDGNPLSKVFTKAPFAERVLLTEIENCLVDSKEKRDLVPHLLDQAARLVEAQAMIQGKR